jgi:hypothetical protein
MSLDEGIMGLVEHLGKEPEAPQGETVFREGQRGET